VQGHIQSISFDGREIRLTTGRYAPQAGGSVMIECGDTAILVTATRSSAREGIDFLPLTCDYEERLYAAGRIPGSFFRREGRPAERAILTSRLIDRPIRPLFPGWLRDDLQIVATCLSLDERARWRPCASACWAMTSCSTPASARLSAAISIWSSPAPPRAW
jgi:polyribonucleotide nucleotidyltransferase